VHEKEAPARRHLGMYNDLTFQYPVSMYSTAGPGSKKYTRGKQADTSGYTFNNKDIPDWVRAQRFSWHGVDHMYDGTIEFDDFYQKYLETLLGVDNSIGRVLDYLKDNGLDKETFVFYMGDNGFAFGEHGLIDKRQAYEESMRVPLLARCPGLIRPGLKLKQLVLNLDIGPSILEMAGVKKPVQMEGTSFLPLIKGQQAAWRDRIFYEYYWENAFPQTPTQYAIRTNQYKFIRTQGIWDIDQLFDLQKDPYEVNNLIRSAQHQDIAKQLNKELWDWLQVSRGMQIPLKRINSVKNDHLFKGTW
ncbi:MAG: sulfatase/phosphatase domain-containing protein, partial [Chitinophagaceae bacterium]